MINQPVHKISVMGYYEQTALEIIQEIFQHAECGQVKIVCFDEDDSTLAGVRDGSIFATVVQQPYEFGYQSVQLMAEVLAGDRSGIPANKLKIIPTLIIRRDNVDEFTRKINRLRGRN